MKALVLFLALLSAFLAVPATACDGVQAFYGGYQQPFVFAQQFVSPYQLGFASPVYSFHQPFAFRQSFNHGFGRKAVVFGGHRQQVVVRRDIFGRQRIIVRH